MRPKQFNLEDKVSLAAYFMMLSLAVAGLLRSGVKAREVQLVMLFLLLFPISYYLTIVDYFRYRFPLEPILMVFAGYTIYCVACRYREKHIPPNLVVAPPVV